MKINLSTRLFSALLPALLLITLIGAPANAQQTSPVPQRLVTELILAPQRAAANAASPSTQAVLNAAAAQAGLSEAHPMGGGAMVYRLPQPLPWQEAQALAAQLSAQPGVAYAEPNGYLTIDDPTPVAAQDAVAAEDAPVNDPEWDWQWSLDPYWSYGINLPAAWSITTGNPALVVAVIDTGILYDHPDLVGRTLLGADMISDSSAANDGDGRDMNPADPGDWQAEGDCSDGRVTSSSWHGSHVAGTIAAARNNNIGITGIDGAAKILPVRALGRCGGSYADIADGIRWAAGDSVPNVLPNLTPAKVINLSLGGSGSCPTSLQNAIDRANQLGAIVVVSAGNSGIDAANTTPANCTGVITIGATDWVGDAADFSNYGTLVEVSAPGVDIYSTVNLSENTPDPSGYTYDYKSGTSMAAPTVSGIVSLMLAVNPALKMPMITKILQHSATPYSPYAYYCKPGAQVCSQSGIAHAGRAVNEAYILDVVRTPSVYQHTNLSTMQTSFQVRLKAGVTPTAVYVGLQPVAITTPPVIDPVTGEQIFMVQMPAPLPGGWYDVSVVANGLTYTNPHAMFVGHIQFLPLLRH